MGSDFEKRVEELCLNEGIPIQRIPNNTADFHLKLQFPNAQSSINVIQPKGKDDTLLIGALIEVAQQHRQKLLGLSKEKREDFIWNLRLMLAKREIEFELRHPDNVLEFVRIHKFMFEDGFSKHIFMNTLLDVNRGKMLVIWFIQKELGVPPSSSPPSSESESPMYR